MTNMGGEKRSLKIYNFNEKKMGKESRKNI